MGLVTAAPSQKLVCGDSDFRTIKLHGRPWKQERMLEISDLLADHLSDAQLGELNRAYNDEGVNEIQTVRKVTYHDAVSYEVFGQVEDQSSGYGVLEKNESVKIRIQVGEIIEVQASFEVDGRGFVEVVAVMRHGVLDWELDCTNGRQASSSWTASIPACSPFWRISIVVLLTLSCRSSKIRSRGALCGYWRVCIGKERLGV